MILAREVNLDGRNTCRVNGRIVPLRLLSTLAQHLVGHPWPETSTCPLLRVREHVDILDKYGGLWQLRALTIPQVWLDRNGVTFHGNWRSTLGFHGPCNGVAGLVSKWCLGHLQPFR